MGGHWFDNLARRTAGKTAGPAESVTPHSTRLELLEHKTIDSPAADEETASMSRRRMLTRVGLTSAAVGAYVLPGWSGALAACRQGLTKCFGKCVNLRRNENHCGTCGNRCLSTQYCSKGKCCKRGLTNCRGTCVNLRNNEANCGTCGNTCVAGKYCSKGKCCPEGTVNCGGTCVNLQSSEANCGTCGNACGAEETCVQGVCQGSGECPAGQTLCNGTCVDTNSDPNHCGACEETCEAAACASVTCVDGGCQAVADHTACADNDPCTDDQCHPISGCFHQPANDGTPCGEGNVCVDGICGPACTPGATRGCDTGLPGVCSEGSQTCQPNGTWGSCVQFTSPSNEVCDGLDNDCDGLVDEGNPGGGQACHTGMPGPCASGTTQCQNGVIVCVSNSGPQQETCNHIDDDCDGTVDNGFPNLGQPCTCPSGQTSQYVCRNDGQGTVCHC